MNEFARDYGSFRWAFSIHLAGYPLRKLSGEVWDVRGYMPKDDGARDWRLREDVNLDDIRFRLSFDFALTTRQVLDLLECLRQADLDERRNDGIVVADELRKGDCCGKERETLPPG